MVRVPNSLPGLFVLFPANLGDNQGAGGVLMQSGGWAQWPAKLVGPKAKEAYLPGWLL